MERPYPRAIGRGQDHTRGALAQLKTAPKSAGNSLSCKVSEKSALSVYGLQRMPVTLYVEQWERLLDFADHIRGFIGQCNGKLARKSRG